MYEIKYLPMAIKDLKEIVDYITIILCNKKAALDFIDALDKFSQQAAFIPLLL